MKSFRDSINSIKTKHRNIYIAHLTEDGYPEPFDLPDFTAELKDLVKEAYTVFTLIWGNEVKFGFIIGSQEILLTSTKSSYKIHNKAIKFSSFGRWTLTSSRRLWQRYKAN